MIPYVYNVFISPGMYVKPDKLVCFLITLSDISILRRLFGIPRELKKKDRKELRVHSEMCRLSSFN